MVFGCVGFLRGFALTFGPSLVGTAPFVRKVSSFFQVVNWPAGDAAVRDAARLPQPLDRRRDRTR